MLHACSIACQLGGGENPYRLRCPVHAFAFCAIFAARLNICMAAFYARIARRTYVATASMAPH